MGHRQYAEKKHLRSMRAAAKLLGVPYSTWVYWVYTDFVPKPSIQIGKRLYYSSQELNVIAEKIEGQVRKEANEAMPK